MINSILLALSLLPASASEADHVDADCKGIVEFVLPDRTRVDCLTASHAYEYDWGKKWAEAIGQSLWYAANTGRRAGIVLILRTPADHRGLQRLRRTISHYNLPIDVKTVEVLPRE